MNAHIFNTFIFISNGYLVGFFVDQKFVHSNVKANKRIVIDGYTQVKATFGNFCRCWRNV